MRVMNRESRITLEPVESVVAVRPATGSPTATLQAATLKHFRTERTPSARALPISDTARVAFENAGWIFAEAHPRLSAAARAPGSRRKHTALPVYLDPARNTVLGTELVTVKLEEGMTVLQARARLKADGLSVVERLKFAKNLFVARLPAGQPVEDALSSLEDSGYVYVEPVLMQIIIGRLQQGQPDPEFHKQWQHENAGLGLAKKGSDIRSLAAWATTRGKGARIAVIDNGMQVDHPDLADGIVSGGYFEMTAAGTSEFHPYVQGQFFPDRNHGTFCMGMAGARRNNGVGGCGSAPEAELMPVACAPDQVGTQLTLAKAVAFAADPSTQGSGLYGKDGADVLSCSLGAENGSWIMQSVLADAITNAARDGRGGQGLPIFWAVSNERVPITQDQVCSHPDVIAVGRSGPGDIRDSCAFGPKLEFLAPGVDVFSTQSGGTYGTDSGTSFACPLAAGVAALVLSKYPEWTCDQVRDRLRATCDKIGGSTVDYGPKGHHDDYGFGRINADRALHDPV